MGTLTESPPFDVLYLGSDRAKFLHARSDGIGASDVAAVLGFSRFRTPYDVWADKTGRAPEREQTQAMEWGIALERVVADRFSVRHGHRDRPLPIGKVRPSPGVLRSRVWPWLLATPDRLVDEFDRPAELGLPPVEIKTSTAWLANDWANGSTPDYYRAQSQSQQLVIWGPSAFSAVSDVDAHGWIVPLIGGNDMPEPRRERFDAEFAGLVIEETERFWVDHVKADVPPPLTLQDDVNEYFPVSGAKVVATPEVEALVWERANLSRQMGDAKKHDEELKQRIQMHMLDAALLTDTDGKPLVTWQLPKTPPGSQDVVDLDRLRREFPDAYAATVASVRKTQSRTMLWKVKASA